MLLPRLAAPNDLGEIPGQEGMQRRVEVISTEWRGINTREGVGWELGRCLGMHTSSPSVLCETGEGAPNLWNLKLGWGVGKAGGWGQMLKPPESIVGKVPLPRTRFLLLP